MKIIKPNVKVWGETPTKGIAEMKQWIERAGRVCYKSEDRITDKSYVGFVSKMLSSGHTSVMEASNIVIGDCYIDSKYLTNVNGCTGGNLRAWMEHFGTDTVEDLVAMLDSLRLKPPKEIPQELKRITVEFITNRAVSHQLVRHRTMSFLQESQRYVGYLDGLEFIEPLWYSDPTCDEGSKIDFRNHCEATEKVYRRDIKRGLRREQARCNLTNSVKTHLIMTGNLLEWTDVLSLRCAKGADPETRSLTKYTKEVFDSNGWLLN